MPRPARNLSLSFKFVDSCSQLFVLSTKLCDHLCRVLPGICRPSASLARHTRQISPSPQSHRHFPVTCGERHALNPVFHEQRVHAAAWLPADFPRCLGL